MNRLTALLIAAGIGLCAGSGAAYKLTADHYRAAQLKQEQAAAAAYQARTVELNTVSAELERARNDRKTVYRTITKRVETYIDRPVYVRECVDDDGLRDINAALAGAANPGEPDAALPAAGTAGGQDRR